jgi:NAD(P)-dependent dehydrogenase (short-subunit alcohol dehydrogenase family)
MGRAAALQFARAGAKVFAAARGEPGLLSLQAEIRAAGGVCEIRALDVADPAAVQTLGTDAFAAFGSLDTWVNTAGIWATSPFEDTSALEFERILQVNLHGMAHCLRTALPLLKRSAKASGHGAAFIGFASILGQLGHPLVSAYSASKFGVLGLLDAVRVEMIQQKAPVSITSILPFGTNTPIYNTGVSRIGFVPRPAPLIIQPEVVAAAVVSAAQRPIRQVHGSGQSVVLGLLNQLMPEIMDEVLAELLMPDRQRSKTALPPDAPHGLFTPVADFRVRGDYDDESADRSAYVELQTGLPVADGMSEVAATLDQVLASPAIAKRVGDVPRLRSVLFDLLERRAHNWPSS